MADNTIVPLLEQALCSVIRAEEAPALEGYDIREGHAFDKDNPSLDGKKKLVIVTATRPRRWLESGANFLVDVQVRVQTVHEAATGFDPHDKAFAVLDDMFAPENHDELCQALTLVSGLGVNSYDNAEPWDEARDSKTARHGQALFFEFDTYLRGEAEPE